MGGQYYDMKHPSGSVAKKVEKSWVGLPQSFMSFMNCPELPRAFQLQPWLEKSWRVQGFQGLDLKKVEDKISALNWLDPKIEISSRPWIEKTRTSRQ